jgi:Double zinc ribbon
VYYVLRPVLRPDAPLEDGESRGAAGDEGENPDDDLSPRAVALRALREIEFDRATGKLSDADYARLKFQYTGEAVAALRAEGPPREDAPAVERAPAVAASLTPVAPSCSTHGPRSESGAQFCSECGRRLASAPGYCARCGVALEREARYCHSCGARVAA